MPVRVDAIALRCIELSSGGLAIGIPSSKGPAILLFVPTPPQPEGTDGPAWGALHAHHVARLLPGGASVLGAYTSSSSGTANARALASEIDGLGEREPVVVDLPTVGSVALCHTLPDGVHLGTSGPDVEVVEGLAKSVFILRGRVAFLSQSSSEGVVDTTEVSTIFGGLRIGTDIILSESDPRLLSETVGKSGVAESRVVKVGSLKKVRNSRAGGTDGRTGCLSGSVELCSVVLEGATAGDALKSLRQDFERSCEARAALLKEIAEEDELENGGVRQNAFPMPSRAIAIPLRENAQDSGGLPLSDYAIDGEDLEADVVPRIGELFSWEDGDSDRYDIFFAERSSRFAEEEAAKDSGVLATFNQKESSLHTTRDDTELKRDALACGVAMMFVVASVAICIKAFQEILY